MIVATGRMFRSVRPYVVGQAQILDPFFCYQGAAVLNPASGTFLLTQPIPLQTSREALTFLAAAAFPPTSSLPSEPLVPHRPSPSKPTATCPPLP